MVPAAMAGVVSSRPASAPAATAIIASRLGVARARGCIWGRALEAVELAVWRTCGLDQHAGSVDE